MPPRGCEKDNERKLEIDKKGEEMNRKRYGLEQRALLNMAASVQPQSLKISELKETFSADEDACCR